MGYNIDEIKSKIPSTASTRRVDALGQRVRDRFNEKLSYEEVKSSKASVSQLSQLTKQSLASNDNASRKSRASKITVRSSHKTVSLASKAPSSKKRLS